MAEVSLCLCRFRNLFFQWPHLPRPHVRFVIRCPQIGVWCDLTSGVLCASHFEVCFDRLRTNAFVLVVALAPPLSLHVLVRFRFPRIWVWRDLTSGVLRAFHFVSFVFVCKFRLSVFFVFAKVGRVSVRMFSLVREIA